MKSVQVLPVPGELILKLFLGQVEFSANHSTSIARAFESLLRVPMKESGAPFKQVLQRAHHLVAAHVPDLGPNRLGARVRIESFVDGHRLRADRMRVEPVSLVKDPKIPCEPRVSLDPVGQSFSYCFILSP
jgi:hypothetical protein